MMRQKKKKKERSQERNKEKSEPSKKEAKCLVRDEELFGLPVKICNKTKPAIRETIAKHIRLLAYCCWTFEHKCDIYTGFGLNYGISLQCRGGQWRLCTHNQTVLLYFVRARQQLEGVMLRASCKTSNTIIFVPSLSLELSDCSRLFYYDDIK